MFNKMAIAMKDLYKNLSKVGFGVVLVLTVGSVSPMFGARQSMANDPSSVVYRLYKEFGWVAYFSLLDNDVEQRLGGTILVQPHAILSRYFDEKLARLIEKEAACERKTKGELCNLEFDLLFGLQDTAAAELTVTPRNSNKVLVEYTYPSDQSKIKIEYQLQKVKADWRISMWSTSKWMGGIL